MSFGSSSSSSSISNPFLNTDYVPIVEEPLPNYGAGLPRNLGENRAEYRGLKQTGSAMAATRTHAMKNLVNIVGRLNQDIKHINVLTSKLSAEDYLDRTYKNPTERAKWNVIEEDLDNDPATPENVLVKRDGKIYSIDGYRSIPPLMRQYKRGFYTEFSTPDDRDGQKYGDYLAKHKKKRAPTARDILKKTIAALMKEHGMSAKNKLESGEPNPLRRGKFLSIMTKAESRYWLLGVVPILVAEYGGGVSIPQNMEMRKKWAAKNSELLEQIFMEKIAPQWETIKQDENVRAQMLTAINEARKEAFGGMDLEEQD